MSNMGWDLPHIAALDPASVANSSSTEDPSNGTSSKPTAVPSDGDEVTTKESEAKPE